MSIEEWIEDFKNTSSVKALVAAYDVFSFLDNAYEFWRELFFPDPNYGELILEAVQALWTEMHDLFTDIENAHANGVLRLYRDYNIHRDPEVLDELSTHLNIVISTLRMIIEEWDARDAYRVAEVYNLIVPIDAAVFLQTAAHAQNKGIVQDWDAVHKRNTDEFVRAIKVNQKLLGPYSFEELPNIPCYNESHGKLGMHSWGNDFAEYLRITEVVWQATERLRESTIEGYPDFWFIIANENNCLHASTSDPSVRGIFRFGQKHQNILWRLEYLRHDAARIIHWSGDCLTVDGARVHIRPCRDDHEGQLWDIKGTKISARCTPTSCTDGLNIYRDAEVRVSTGYTPGEREYQNFRVSDPDDAELTPAASGFAFQNRAPESKFDYEFFTRRGDYIQHYWRGWRDGRWHKGQSFGTNVQSEPAAFQNFALGGSKHHFEVFVRESDRIQHYWCSSKDSQWHKGQSFGTNVYSAPAAFQNWGPGSKYNYEVFAREGNHIQHYWRGWKDGRWHKGQSFGTNVQSAPAAFRNIEINSLFSYEVFVREGDRIQHYYRVLREAPSSGNRPPSRWVEWVKGQSFGTNLFSAPAAFQNFAPGSKYNYEVFVGERDHIQHYYRGWRDRRWHKGQSFG